MESEVLRLESEAVEGKVRVVMYLGGIAAGVSGLGDLGTGMLYVASLPPAGRTTSAQMEASHANSTSLCLATALLFTIV